MLLRFQDFYLLLLLILISKDIQAQTNEQQQQCKSEACCVGCLRCVDNKCKICDYERYINIDGICHKLTDEEVSNNYKNCQQINQIGQCVLCSNNHYLDYNQKCQEVLKPINNCYRYKNFTECQICQKEYIVKNGQCEKVTSVINNCLLYDLKNDGDVICTQCEKNYIQSQDLKQCLLNDQPNCLTFQYIDCLSCKSNTQDVQYIKTDTPLYTQLDQNTKVLEFVQKQYLSLSVNIKTFNFCQPVQFNCKDFYDDLQCADCKEGYYLDENGNCQQNMIFSIPNCAVQNEQNECLQCVLNYYLENKVCVQQPSNILYCIQYSYNKQGKLPECIKCQDGYFLSNDKQFCGQKILNCQVHQFTCNGKSYTDCNMQCTQCADFYYLNYEKKCIIGTIKNCMKISYINQKEICLKCQNQYYLESNKCTKHILNEKCDLYDQFIPNKCIKGLYNYFPINKNFQCISNTLLIDQFYYQNKDVMQKFLENCEYKQVQDILNLTCLECKANTIPINLKQVNLCLKKPKNFQPINNCNVYKINNQQQLTCFECQKDYYFDEENNCIKNCENKFKQINITADNFEIRCTSTSTDNCLIKLNYETQQIKTQTCFQCSENKALLVDMINYSNNTLHGNDLLIFNEQQFVNTICDDGFSDSNCAIVMEFQEPIGESNHKVCLQCKSGYKNSLCQEKCVASTQNCEIQFMKGMPLLYNLIGLCKCQSSQIPFITIQKNDFDTQEEFVSNNFDVLSIQEEQLYHPHGSDEELELAGISEKGCQSSQSQVSNCALEIKIETYEKKGLCQLHDTQYFCLACKPNYKPIYEKLIDIMPGFFLKVSTCLEITNCSTNSQLQNTYNSCTQCSTNYVLDYYGVQKLCKDNANSKNCRVYDYNQNRCKICNDGYIQENNGCREFQFDIHFCSQKNFIKTKNFQIFDKIYLEIFFGGSYPKDYGCTQCTSDDYFLVRSDSYFNSCLQSTYQQSPNCLRYSSSYRETFDYTCSTCSNLLPIQSVSQVCPNDIIKNQVINCSTYNSNGTQCIRCEENYVLMNYGPKMSQQLCFLSTINECLYQIVNKDTFVLECQSCQLGQTQIQTDSQNYLLTQYYQLVNIENCITYNNYADLKQVDLLCQECLSTDPYIKHSGYFLSNNKCQKRTNLDQYCIKFEKNLDYCQYDGCIQGAFFNKDQKKCVYFNSITNCKVFKSHDECKQCLPGYYLKEVLNSNYKNQCYKVEQKYIIEFCVVYDENQQCQQCFKSNSQNYFLTQDAQNKSICMLSEAQNCRSQIIFNECQTCYPGYYLDQNKDCVENDDSNCVFYQEDEINFFQIQSGHCKYCENNLVAQNSELKGQCIQIDDELKIKYCLHNKLEKEIIYCTLCEENFTLSLDGRQCRCLLPATIQNDICSFENEEFQLCQNFISTKDRVCSLCKFGYFLEEQIDGSKKCKKCSEAGVENCMMCNIKTNIKVCEICQIGYYMNEDKKCLKNFYN